MNELILSAYVMMGTCKPIKRLLCNRDMLEESVMLEYSRSENLTFIVKVSHESRYGTSEDRGEEKAWIGAKYDVKKWRW